MINQDDLNYIQILWNFMKLNQSLEKTDCIIVLGCSDIKVADVAIDVYNQGLANKIIFSGGYGKITKIFRKFQRRISLQNLQKVKGYQEKIYTLKINLQIP